MLEMTILLFLKILLQRVVFKKKKNNETSAIAYRFNRF